MALWSDDQLAGMPPGRESALAWVELRSLELQSLVGKRVWEWYGMRMALREEGPDGLPQFDDLAIPLIQLDHLYVGFADGEWVQILTHQDDDEWGLYAQKCPSKPHLEEDGNERDDRHTRHSALQIILCMRLEDFRDRH